MDIILELNCSRCNVKYKTGGGGSGMCPDCSHNELAKMPEWIAFCEAMGFNPDAKKVSDLYVAGNSVGMDSSNIRTDRSRNRSKKRGRDRQGSQDNRRKKKDE